MPERGPRRSFTAREDEIADGIGDGLSFAEIGARLRNLHTGALGISAHTVAAHVKAMAMQFDAYYEFELSTHFTPREIIWLYVRDRRLKARAAQRRTA